MSPEQLLEQIRMSDRRREYARLHPILCAIATGALVGGIIVVATPAILSASSLGVLPVPLRVAWTVLYTTGGVCVLYAFAIHPSQILRSLRLEAFGLTLLASCFTVYSVAILSKRGWTPGALAASVFLAIAVGTTARVWTIISDRRVPWSSRHH